MFRLSSHCTCVHNLNSLTCAKQHSNCQQTFLRESILSVFDNVNGKLAREKMSYFHCVDGRRSSVHFENFDERHFS